MQLRQRCPRQPHRGAIASQLRSDALENLRASHPCHAAIRGDVCRDPSCGNGCRADKASGPDRGRSAIWRPVPRRLEHNPRASNAACQIKGDSWTGARRTADKDSGEISRRVDRQNLQQRAPLTLPNGREQALGRRRSSGCEKKKQSGDDTGHILLQLVVVCRTCRYRRANVLKCSMPSACSTPSAVRMLYPIRASS